MKKKNEPQRVIVFEEHEYVDLWLSVNWAPCNVGASKPDDNGDYFAWSETKPYYESLNPLVWKDDRPYGYERYSSSDPDNVNYNEGSGKPVLAPEHDAAHVNWGGEWRMPTREEMEELLNPKNCRWTYVDSLACFKIESRKRHFKGNFIYLPAESNWFSDIRFFNQGSAWYWSSTKGNGIAPSHLYIHHSHNYDEYYINCSMGRYHCGYQVRPVCPK